MGAPALQDGPRHVVLGCYSNFSFLRGPRIRTNGRGGGGGWDGMPSASPM